MLRESFSGRDELVRQWASAEVRTIDECGCLAIRPAPGSPQCRTQYRVPAEGSWPDDDRTMVEVLLRVDEAGYLHELEFVRYPGGPRIDDVDPETMWVFAPPYRPKDDSAG